MKKFILLGLLCFTFFTVFGQFDNPTQEISFFQEKLNIQEDQMASLTKIINRKYADLESIESKRSSNEEVFRSKRRSIYEGCNSSIRLMMTDEQLDLWVAYKKEERLKNAKRIKELRAAGADKDELLDAQVGIY